MNVYIIGSGKALTKKIVRNSFFENVGSSNEWIFNNLGIKQRKGVIDETTNDLAAKAGKEAIHNAGLKVKDIDLIIVATSTQDKQAPSCASYVQNKLFAFNAALLI